MAASGKDAGLAAGAASGDGGTLAPSTLRLPADRSFDKRKLGAQEVEKHMRRLREAGGSKEPIRRVLTTLAQDFALSLNQNQRKGGLIGLASCAIALGGELTSANLDILVPTV